MTADPVAILNERFSRAMRGAFGAELPAGADAMIAPSRSPQFGDFQSNAAMPLSKALGRPPREVAQAILAGLDVSDIAEAPEIAGPGFINIRLKAHVLGAALASMDTPALGIEAPAPGEKQTVVVDLCGVNLAKQMHVGHLRATVIGDALARLWGRLGHDAVRQNHFGDWGLPIAMVTAEVKRMAERGEIDLGALTLDDLERMYRAAQRHCEADRAGLEAVRKYGLGPKAEAELGEQVAGAEEALADAKRALVALQAHEPAYVAIWKTISDITLRACFENCRRLQADVKPEYTAGESTYAEELPEVVRDLESRGIAEPSEGALVVRLDEFGIKEPLLIRKSDGGYLYATTDIAGIRRRVRKLGADRLVYAVDARQSHHFRQVYGACRKAGYTRTNRGGEAELIHAAFGTVLGEDNRPLKTRSGENVKLSDLLDEAVVRAQRAVAEKNPGLSEAERGAIAEAVGIGAIKYADLAGDRLKDYVFSFDRMLAFEGNTGPYLQYALVRIHSIFRKARERISAALDALDLHRSLPGDDAPPFLIGAPEEKAIALALLKYPGVVRGSAEACEPHRLCTYLFELATAFSGFFQACPVLQAPDDATRLARLRLCRLTGRVLRDGLECLGIAPLERM